MSDSFKQPYADAGHDVESLFAPRTAHKCSRCGSYLIDLSEDLSYGEMRKCLASQDDQFSLSREIAVLIKGGK